MHHDDATSNQLSRAEEHDARDLYFDVERSEFRCNPVSEAQTAKPWLTVLKEIETDALAEGGTKATQWREDVRLGLVRLQEEYRREGLSGKLVNEWGLNTLRYLHNSYVRRVQPAHRVDKATRAQLLSIKSTEMMVSPCSQTGSLFHEKEAHANLLRRRTRQRLSLRLSRWRSIMCASPYKGTMSSG